MVNLQQMAHINLELDEVIVSTSFENHANMLM